MVIHFKDPTLRPLRSLKDLKGLLLLTLCALCLLWVLRGLSFERSNTKASKKSQRSKWGFTITVGDPHVAMMAPQDDEIGSL